MASEHGLCLERPVTSSALKVPRRQAGLLLPQFAESSTNMPWKFCKKSELNEVSFFASGSEFALEELNFQIYQCLAKNLLSSLHTFEDTDFCVFKLLRSYPEVVPNCSIPLRFQKVSVIQIALNHSHAKY